MSHVFGFFVRLALLCAPLRHTHVLRDSKGNSAHNQLHAKKSTPAKNDRREPHVIPNSSSLDHKTSAHSTDQLNASNAHQSHSLTADHQEEILSHELEQSAEKTRDIADVRSDENDGSKFHAELGRDV